MQNYDYTVDVAGKDGEGGESGICLKMQEMEVEGMEGDWCQGEGKGQKRQIERVGSTRGVDEGILTLDLGSSPAGSSPVSMHPYSTPLIAMPRPLASTSKATNMSPPSPVDELTATLFDALLPLPPARKATLLLDISLSLIDAGR